MAMNENESELLAANVHLQGSLNSQKELTKRVALLGLSTTFLAAVIATFSGKSTDDSYQESKNDGEVSYSQFVDENPYIIRLSEEEIRAQNPHHFQVSEK